MAKKIFISYKHSDSNVQPLSSSTYYRPTTARSYVDIIQEHFENTGDHIYKGEDNNESLANFKNDAIRSKLSDKIYDSSITLVLISPNMKENYKLEKDQWIPWEISYSLKRKTRNTISSTPNAILAIILPDRYGSYEYARNSNFGFEIINKNRNNLKYIYPSKMFKISCSKSYILMPTWEQFTSNYNGWIEAALEIRQNIDKYNISKSV